MAKDKGNQGDGTHPGAVRADRPAAPQAAGERQAGEPRGADAILHVAEHGCKWRGLPARFGRWHTVYMRMSRWTRKGVLDQVLAHLQRDLGVHVDATALGLDSTSVKVHPDGTGARKKSGPQAIGKSRGGWNTKIHMVASDDRTAVAFALSPGHAHDAPEGRKLLESMGKPPDAAAAGCALVMDKAYEDDATRALARDLGFEPVVPPKSNRKEPWEYDRKTCKRRNEVERLFRRIKGFRRVFTRFDKLDRMFLGFVAFALIADTLRQVAQ